MGDGCQDAFSKLPQDPDQDAVKVKRAEYAAGKLKAFIDILAKKLDESGGPFLTGETLTIADIVAKYFVIEPLKNGEFPHIAKEYVEQWPALLRLDTDVENHAIVKAYQASKGS